MGTLETWVNELVVEMANQKDAVDDVIEVLGDRTECWLNLVEERKVTVGEGSSGGEGSTPRLSYTFKNITHMEPLLLMKEMRPSELRSWELKFNSWLSCSLQGSAPVEFYVLSSKEKVKSGTIQISKKQIKKIQESIK